MSGFESEWAPKVRSEDGKNAIYVFGTVSYKDIFEEEWLVKFCHVYYGQRSVRVPGDEIYRDREGRYCDIHNDRQKIEQRP